MCKAICRPLYAPLFQGNETINRFTVCLLSYLISYIFSLIDSNIFGHVPLRQLHCLTMFVVNIIAFLLCTHGHLFNCYKTDYPYQLRNLSTAIADCMTITRHMFTSCSLVTVLNYCGRKGVHSVSRPYKSLDDRKCSNAYCELFLRNS